MGRLAPGAPSNIHPFSGLYKHAYAPTVPAAAFAFPPMTLAAACASGMPYVPVPTRSEVCGCGRC